ncbi:Uncharacterised protein [Legionella beliardensis]|uniref:Uncharacterized protein n=1 Tax=Legionella beliardensis TaxID=91822 RepID=A0A378HZQ0_9GAMM|nr:hypothetical protein [Legionella beliardensis]STX27940.1 Uncharacterised protein [Legionella beliardensis]
MNAVNKEYTSRNYRLSSTKSKINLKNRVRNQKKKQIFKNPLPKFLNWIKRRIDSGDREYALDAQDLILYKPSQANAKLIFILPEVFERYYRYSGISAKLIQAELKKALMINFTYTIVRNEKVIEVFPYQLPLPKEDN